MGKDYITADRILLVMAVIFFAAHPFKPESPTDFVSFNDGTLECVNIFVQPSMSREVQANLLRGAADRLLETGCVNFSFPKE